MKILLIGEVYSENLGDALICETVKRIVLQYDKDAIVEYFDISGRISFEETYHIKQTISSVLLALYIFIRNIRICLPVINNRSIFVRYMKALCLLEKKIWNCKYDVVLFAGGALFQDYFVDLIYAITRRLRKKKVRVIFNAIGLGNLNAHSICVLRKTFLTDNIYSISLRDSYVRFNELFNVSCEVKETQDPALNCSYFFSGSCNVVSEYGIGCIEEINSLETLKDIICFMNKRNLDWKLFCNGLVNDLRMGERAMMECGLSDDIPNKIIKRPLNAEELVSVVTGFSKVVSFRLHSHVVASSFQIPTYGFVWDDKVKEFLDKQGRGEFVGSLNSEVNLQCICTREFQSVNKRLIEKNALISKNNLLAALYKEYIPSSCME